MPNYTKTLTDHSLAELLDMTVEELFDLLPTNICVKSHGPVYFPKLGRDINRSYYLEYNNTLNDVEYGKRKILFRTNHSKSLKSVLVEAVIECGIYLQHIRKQTEKD